MVSFRGERGPPAAALFELPFESFEEWSFLTVAAVAVVVVVVAGVATPGEAAAEVALGITATDVVVMFG